MGQDSCVLMFSGGRDSTLAAVRLHNSGHAPILVTITSDHLTGIGAVFQRLAELKKQLPLDTRWLTVVQPTELKTDTSFYEQTCLSCHHAYVVVAAAIALSRNAKCLAFGYAGYQNGWPEQTPLAVERLAAVMKSLGIELLLPVYDLASRLETTEELRRYGLATESLEQKCSRQISNVVLSEDRLRSQIDKWEKAILESAANLASIEIKETAAGTLRDL